MPSFLLMGAACCATGAGGGELTPGGGKLRLHPALQRFVEALLPSIRDVPDERKRLLARVARFVEARRRANEPAHLTFICTHNSRRSHLTQLWAATAAAYYGVDGVQTFSGGTETTAFEPRAVAAMERAGFEIESPGGENPHYRVTFSSSAPAQECFSKLYDDSFNPQGGYAAILTCSQADESCPTVRGAALRIPIPYSDPKAADDTPEETATYDARVKQVATEMLSLFSQVRE
jgi:arsenate reductase